MTQWHSDTVTQWHSTQWHNHSDTVVKAGHSTSQDGSDSHIKWLDNNSTFVILRNCMMAAIAALFNKIMTHKWHYSFIMARVTYLLSIFSSHVLHQERYCIFSLFLIDLSAPSLWTSPFQKKLPRDWKRNENLCGGAHTLAASISQSAYLCSLRIILFPPSSSSFSLHFLSLVLRSCEFLSTKTTQNLIPSKYRLQNTTHTHNSAEGSKRPSTCCWEQLSNPLTLKYYCKMRLHEENA